MPLRLLNIETAMTIHCHRADRVFHGDEQISNAEVKKNEVATKSMLTAEILFLR